MARLAVVSGGGTGIGRATAGMLAGEGYDVIIVGRRPDVLTESELRDVISKSYGMVAAKAKPAKRAPGVRKRKTPAA